MVIKRKGKSRVIESSMIKGKITNVLEDAKGAIEIMFSPNRETNNLWKSWEVISLDSVNLETVKVTKPITEKNRILTIDQFMQLAGSSKFVRFVDQFGGPREMVGRIKKLDFNRNDGISGTFVLAQDDGTDLSHSVNSVIPESIETFFATPWSLSDAETVLLAHLGEAFKAGNYVSFRARDEKEISHGFEGWITEIELSSVGDYLISVNDHLYKKGTNTRRRKYKLSEIVPESFNATPSRALRPDTGTGEYQPDVFGFIDVSKRPALSRGVLNIFGQGLSPIKTTTRKIRSLSKSLLNDLAVFAHPELVSGPEFPQELQRLVPRRSELRLYFQVAESSMRLTVRRNRDGAWAIGGTGADGAFIDEDYRSNWDNEDTRYGLNETNFLKDSASPENSSVAWLRGQLEYIHIKLLKTLIPLYFSEEYIVWKSALPLEMDSYEVHRLFLHHMGYEFYLDRGFVPVEKPVPLYEEEAKLLAAFTYLVDNNLEFWSYNAGCSGVTTGIYPRGSCDVDQKWLAGYSLAGSLLKSMEKHGLEYRDGAWVEKPASNK